MTTQRLAGNPVSRIFFDTVRPLVHLARRTAHPGLPLEHKMLKAKFKGQTVSFRVRRWSFWDACAVQQCFTEAQYDMPDGAQGKAVDEIYRSIVASGRKPLIMDCGANIGASVRWFLLRYPEAHIVAIEPAPDNFEMLRLNVVGLDVDTRQAGIANEDGRAFLMNEFGAGAEMGWRVTFEPNELSVDLLSVKTLLAEKPAERFTPFLLKLDIEGAEKTLFSSDNSAIDRFPMIIMEPHDWLHPGEQISREFFRFHVEAGREFAMKHENVASLALFR